MAIRQTELSHINEVRFAIPELHVGDHSLTGSTLDRIEISSHRCSCREVPSRPSCPQHPSGNSAPSVFEPAVHGKFSATTVNSVNCQKTPTRWNDPSKEGKFMAKNAPSLDPREVHFPPTDFEKFHERIQRDSEFNDARLEIRRKLDALGKHLVSAISTKEVELVSRASLHHPYQHNGFRVASQWVYLSRGERERKAIVRHLGVDLGKDLDQNYTHSILVLEISEKGLEIALRIHKGAWWDGENLKRACASREYRTKLASQLQLLKEYGLRIGDHRRVRPCGELTERDLAEALSYYKPGDHWLHIERAIDRSDEFVTEPQFLDRVESEFRTLIPVYQIIRWSKKNDRLFGSA